MRGFGRRRGSFGADRRGLFPVFAFTVLRPLLLLSANSTVLVSAHRFVPMLI
jgi:hypothetical protein